MKAQTDMTWEKATDTEINMDLIDANQKSSLLLHILLMLAFFLRVVMGCMSRNFCVRIWVVNTLLP